LLLVLPHSLPDSDRVFDRLSRGEISSDQEQKTDEGHRLYLHAQGWPCSRRMRGHGKLKDETDLEALNDDLVGVVAETMQPEHVGLLLRPPQDRTMQSKLGESEVEDV
jgi:hypothetical protein